MSRSSSLGADLGAARVAELLAQFAQLGADHRRAARRDSRGSRSGRAIVSSSCLVFVGELFLLQPGQAVQAHLEDFLRLHFGQLVAVVDQAEARRAGLPDARRRRRPRRAARAPGPAPSARASMRSRATCGLAEVLISSIISSMLASATVRPSRMWARARALRSSKMVRRVTTSRRWRTKASRICLRLSSCGLAVDQRHHVDAEHALQLRSAGTGC